MATTTTTTTTTTTSKKKFGKNLNKLTKPPAPPAASESKSNNASRNGLLLLSANKQKGTSSTKTSGLLSSKPAVPTAPSLKPKLYEPSASTQDILLGAVVGASSHEKPDAWGVAAQQQQQHQQSEEKPSEAAPVVAPVLAPNDGISPSTTIATSSSGPAPSVLVPKPPSPPPPGAVAVHWDEYGGRGTSSSAAAARGLVNSGEADNADDQQKLHMARLAKERAERRRNEELARENQQKEKAAQRLKELEQKLAKSQPAPSEQPPPEPADGRGQNIQNPLGRTLFDPNRTYSSLVGGNVSVGSVDSGQRGGGQQQQSPAQEQQPVIHLSSYEDRDRGEQPRAAAPRMLFDPKSGKMVAMPSRDDSAGGRGGGAGRGKGGRGGAKGGRKEEEATSARNSKKKNERTKPARKEPKKVAVKGGSKTSNNAGSTNNNPERKLPRTRGVLYARDDKGNVYCADGCDGDLGYGAHSVAGGRARNPDAYLLFTEQQQQLYKEQVPPDGKEQYDAFGIGNNYDTDDQLASALHTGFSLGTEAPLTPVVDWLKPNEKIELVTGVDESPTLQATAREWAPSQAALAAAAVVGLPSMASSVDLEEEEEEAEGMESDDDVPSFMGLGFDPTKDMDMVIQSPSGRAEPNSKFDTDVFESLALEPPLSAAALASASNRNHIFAFGSSATWGTASENIDMWGAPTSSSTPTASRLFGGVLSGGSFDGAESNTSDNNDQFLSSSFAGAGNSNWTEGGVPGLAGGGSGASTSSAGGEHGD